MNDEFLYQLREEPGPQFTKTLRRRLNQTLPTRSGQDGKAGRSMNRHSIAKRMTLTLVALILVFALTLAVSPTVRAAFSTITKTIIMKGMTIWVSDDLPAVKGESETYSLLWTPISPADLAVNYPDLVAKLPTWAPPGYVLQERAAMFGNMIHVRPDQVLLEWKNKFGGILQLQVSKGACPNGPLWESGAPRSDCAYQFYIDVSSDTPPEVIMIHEQSAILFPDFQMLMDLSGPIQEWNPYRGKYDTRDPQASYLIWEADGMTYQIAAKSWMLSKEDLIRFAESIP